MNTAEHLGMPYAQRLRAAFDAIIEMKAEHKEMAEQIKDAIDKHCKDLDIAQKAFKAGLAYYGLTDGERQDLDKAIEMAKQATGDTTTGDLFQQDMERAFNNSVVQFERGKNREHNNEK